MVEKSLTLGKILGTLKKLNQKKQGRYARVYFWSLTEDISPLDCLNDGKHKGIIKSWKSYASRRRAYDLFYNDGRNNMLDDKFIKRANRPGDYYKANPGLIKKIVRYSSFSESEASVVENIWCNPQKSYAKTAKHYWHKCIRRLLREKNSEFLSFFIYPILEENARELVCTYNPEERDTARHLSILHYASVSDPLNLFVMRGVSKRIYVQHNLKEQCKLAHLHYPIVMENFINTQVFTHLFTYPPPNVEVRRDNPEIILKFENQDLFRILKESCSFIGQRKHMIKDYYTEKYYGKDYRDRGKRGAWKKYFYKSFYDFFRSNIFKWEKDLDSKSELNLRNRPFLMTLKGDSNLIKKRLRELEKKLDEQIRKKYSA